MSDLVGPLPYEWLGVLALGILWVNTLLIAAAAMKRRARIGAVLAGLVAARRDGALIAGVVEEGRGPGGALATRRVEQIGRAMTTRGPDRILFTDRRARSEVHGGVVRTDGGERVEVPARPGEDAEVWIAGEVAPPRSGDFEAAWSRASTNKGLASTLELAVSEGARVWVERAAPGGDPIRVATIDPIATCERKRSMLLGFAAAAVLGCAIVSAIALWPPAFGAVSTIGGVLCVAYFLAIQPLGTAARDAARLPPEGLVGGIWQRP